MSHLRQLHKKQTFNYPTNEKNNFHCVTVACVDVIKLSLRDILASFIQPKDLFKEISSCTALKNGKHKLSPDQLTTCCLSPHQIPDYDTFDVTLLYKLIRHLCPSSVVPTKGWDKQPDAVDIMIGDDIERLRLFRNNYYAHAHSAVISDTEFRALWSNLKSILKRIKSYTGCNVDYNKRLIEIEQCKFENNYVEGCKLLLDNYLTLRGEDKDQAEIMIIGEEEVLCGDETHFEATVKGTEASEYTITWQKHKGLITERIDTNKEKYRKSTGKKLVIQSMCKDDEGEYQAVLTKEINGNDFKVSSNKIRLHALGEIPFLDELKITAGDEGITIHYNCVVSEKSPKLQHIKWSRNGETVNVNSPKFIGGSLKEKFCTLKTPSTDDRGKYTCTVTNAVGCTSKTVILELPSVKISVDPIVCFGSKATIQSEVFSTPEPEKIEWQKSKDGYDFRGIDLTKPKYYGSSDLTKNPKLIVLKTSFDDKLHYRLLVWNKIGESISKTVYLNVTGNVPNITTSHETNIQKKSLKLIGNVFLYDASPAIEEVLWLKNGEKIDVEGSGGRLSSYTICDPSLTIRNVCQDDAGEYQLTATNAVGSTNSDVIILGDPEIFLERSEKKEDKSQCCVATIHSIPAPSFVEWSLKGSSDETFTLIDSNAAEYKGTTNSLPHPVLVVKNTNQLENNSFRIEVRNFVGSSVKIFSGVVPRKFYKDQDTGIRFAKLSNYIATHFPNEKLQKLKFILRTSGKVKDETSLSAANSILECISILHDENLFTQKDVIFMQFLCKETDCEEMYTKCIDFAKAHEALCFFEKPPENGYKEVQFHVQGDLNDYTKENIQRIVTIVAAILDCKVDDIVVNGYRHSTSFILVLLIKEGHTSKLSAMNDQDRLKLMKLNIDFLIVDGKTIRLERSKDVCSLKRQTLSPILKTTVTLSDWIYHISCVSTKRMWVSSIHSLFETGETGKNLMNIDDADTTPIGNHTITNDGDLLFFKQFHVYSLNSSGQMKRLNIGPYPLSCIHSSKMNNDILIGSSNIVTRHSKQGEQLQEIKLDGKGRPLYGKLHYITENLNGDIIVSDNEKQSVISVNKAGNFRFAYPGCNCSTDFKPCGIDTDIHGQIMVCNASLEDPSVYLLNMNGQYLMHLFTRQHYYLRTPSAICIDRNQNIYVGDKNKILIITYLKDK